MRVFSRVEMWCRVQAVTVVLPLLFTGWLATTEALTTFGKTDTQVPKATPTAPPGKVGEALVRTEFKN